MQAKSQPCQQAFIRIVSGPNTHIHANTWTHRGIPLSDTAQGCFITHILLFSHAHTEAYHSLKQHKDVLLTHILLFYLEGTSTMPTWRPHLLFWSTDACLKAGGRTCGVEGEETSSKFLCGHSHNKPGTLHFCSLLFPSVGGTLVLRSLPGEEGKRKKEGLLRDRQNPVSKMFLDISWIHSYAGAGGLGGYHETGEFRFLKYIQVVMFCGQADLELVKSWGIQICRVPIPFKWGNTHHLIYYSTQAVNFLLNLVNVLWIGPSTYVCVKEWL